MNVFISTKSGADDTLLRAVGQLATTNATLSKMTPHFGIFAMPGLGAGGDQVVAGVQSVCETDYNKLCQWFGIQVPHFNVTLAQLSKFVDGTGGAYHASCASTDLYCDVRLNPAVDPVVSAALMVAEAVEAFEAKQGAGWACGASNGEGLSRVLSSECHPGVLDALGYPTAAAWLDDLRSDWVNVTNQTDRSPYSNGCAVLFLNWLNRQLKVGWDKICQAGGSTLGETYQRVGGPLLTGQKDAFVAFRALLDLHFPVGTACGLTTDNPFPLP
jgi:hypothetical protein